jgi:hypothetical protein
VADSFDELVQRTTASQTRARARRRIVELLNDLLGSQSATDKLNSSLESTADSVDGKPDVVGAGTLS